jgi:hypothetical protein
MALPTPQDVFLQQTSLDPAFIANVVISDRPTNFTEEEKQWFIEHTDKWVRWFHANNPKWTESLNGPENKGRDLLWMFINHWADAYEHNRKKYQKQHPMEDLV